MTRIKICGITREEDARCAAKAGVDFLGFVFYSKSPRFVTPGQAGAIANAVRREFGASTPRLVGVFVDEPVERVRAVLEGAELDLAQLHGRESPDQVRMLHPRGFKAIRPRTLDEAEAAVADYCQVAPREDDLPQLLVDAYHPHRPGGTGLRADLAVAKWLARHVRLVLAGGLSPETVTFAIEEVQPWGVDVSSGVEAAGSPRASRRIKDHARIRAFVAAVRAADAGSTGAR